MSGTKYQYDVEACFPLSVAERPERGPIAKRKPTPGSYAVCKKVAYKCLTQVNTDSLTCNVPVANRNDFVKLAQLSALSVKDYSKKKCYSF